MAAAAPTYRQLMQQQGYVIVPGAASATVRTEFIDELWDILENQPRRAGRHLVRPVSHTVDLAPAWIKKTKENFVPHMLFGGLCEPPMFHMKAMWKIRQNPLLVDAFVQLLRAKSSDDLLVELNRPKMVLPTQGQEELCHWDNDPFHWDNDGRADTDGFHAIVAISNVTVSLSTERTWTKAWVKKFRRDYAALKKKKRQAKISVPADADVQQLHDDAKWQSIIVPAGSMIVWSNRLLHSASKNKTKRIVYGMYHSYQLHSKVTDKCISDMQSSYHTGKMPSWYPSGDKTHYMPFKWQNFPKIVAKFIERFPHGHERGSHIRVVRSTGQQVPTLVEPSPLHYKKPKLTSLGQCLLGMDDESSDSDSSSDSSDSSVTEVD